MERAFRAEGKEGDKRDGPARTKGEQGDVGTGCATNGATCTVRQGAGSGLELTARALGLNDPAVTAQRAGEVVERGTCSRGGEKSRMLRSGSGKFSRAAALTTMVTHFGGESDAGFTLESFRFAMLRKLTTIMTITAATPAPPKPAATIDAPVVEFPDMSTGCAAILVSSVVVAAVVVPTLSDIVIVTVAELVVSTACWFVKITGATTSLFNATAMSNGS